MIRNSFNCFLLTLQLLSVPVSAHLPELYGREYLRVDPATFKVPQNRDLQRTLRPASAEESAYEQQLRDLEAAAGPYSPGLTDPLSSLSSAQLKRGDPEDAINTLRRAIHLIRINDGLYSARQQPLLRRLIELYRAQADYVSLGEVYGYYYRVSALAEGPLTVDGVAQIIEYLDWERQLYASRADGEERNHLLRAYKANKAMLQRAESAEAALYIQLAMSQMRNLYLILGDKPMEMEAISGEMSREQRQLSSLQTIAYHKGRKLLQQCLARSEHFPPRERAEIYLELGDWQLWNDHPFRASSQYRLVQTLMEQAGEHALLAQWFDEPVALPNKLGLWPLLHEENGRQPVVVTASYETNRKGESRRVEASVENDEHEWQARKIRAMLRDTHFRPRIGKEGPEAGRRVTRHYRLIAIN